MVGNFESSYSNIYPEGLQLNKENTDKYETSFLDLDTKIKDGKLYFELIRLISFFYCQNARQFK